jgi:hypothetical protein
MAVGDITRDSGSPRQNGNQWTLEGTIEVDDIFRAYALGGTKITLTSVSVVSEDGVGSARVRVNEDATGVSTNGTIAVQGNHQSVDTYRFRASYI